MYSSLPDSPQPVGDLIGSGIRICRRNIRLIFQTLLVPTIFTTVAGVVFQWVFTYGASGVAQTKDIGAAVGLFALWSVAALVFFGAWWVLGLRLLALVRIALGFSTNYVEAWAFMKAHRWNLLGVYFLGVVVFSVAMTFLAIVTFAAAFASGAAGSSPGIAGGLAIVFGICACTIMIVTYLLATHISFCVLACEDLTVPAVIGRSLSLVFRNFWRALGFGSLFSLTFLIISCPLSLPIAAMTFVDALQHGLASHQTLAEAYKPPLYLLVLAQTWESVIGIVLRPMVLFCFALFYYDLRLRTEGLDMKRRLQMIEPQAT